MDVNLEQMSAEERKEIISYGMKRGKVILISTLLTIIMGGILGIFWQSVIFWFCLSILRKYAGGYHANTEKQCYVISFIIVLVSLLCIKIINYSVNWGILLHTISLLVIFFLAPVENVNHILDEEEKKKYGIRIRVIEGLLYAAHIFLYFTNMQYMTLPLVIANIVVAVSLFAGYKKSKAICYSLE